MGFSVATWNVEHFKLNPEGAVDNARAQRVADILAAVDPDVFAIFEVKGKSLFTPLTQALPNHSFHIIFALWEAAVSERGTFTRRRSA